MPEKFNTVEEYVAALPAERKDAINGLREVIKQNLPQGFEECINYGMIGYVVPHSIYPNGYHVDPELPLPFINLASQKNFVGFYHLGIYADKKLLDWWVNEYPNHAKRKLDMGKSCVRLKYLHDIPYDLIGELASKVSPKDWIEIYEQNIKKT